jgi:DnaJ family protein C protein 8
MQAFYNEMRDVDRENEVNRILGAFRLNPFEQLGVRFDTPPEDIRRAYRKVSLMVHPDKCTHPRAKEAFEVIGEAQKALLDDEKRTALVYLLNHAKDRVLEEWRRAAKHDAAVRLAAAITEGGKAGVEEAFLASDDFHQKWRTAARDVLAKSEWKRRQMTKRVSAYGGGGYFFLGGGGGVFVFVVVREVGECIGGNLHCFGHCQVARW